jgi:hypothetical protein
VSGDVAPHPAVPSEADAAEAAATHENATHLPQKCLQELDALNRRIITRYYVGSARVKIDNRRELAESLGRQRECPDNPGVPDPYTPGSVCPAVCGCRVKGFQQEDLSNRERIEDRRSRYLIRA